MDMTGERQIAAKREAVWAALNDPAVLKACIPGCEILEKVSDTQMTVTAAVKLGPVATHFSGKLDIFDPDPPNGYTLSGEGQGGPAGAAKGAARVRLEDSEGGTRLIYTVKAQVGGRIAQVGGRLIDATAKSMAEQFFARFARRLEHAESAAVRETQAKTRKAAALSLPLSAANFFAGVLTGLGLAGLYAVALLLPLTEAHYLTGVLTGLGLAGLFTLALRLIDSGRRPSRRRA